MSWMKKLYDTYETALSLPVAEGKLPLMPISHTPQNAHINIILDSEGKFQSAKVLEKTQIILPATEDSASRSSGEAPHPFADKLQYVARDYADFGGQKKAYFVGYEEQLKKWCDSEHGHEQVKAVLRYIQKGTVIQDLVNLKILHVDTNNKLLTTWEGQEGEQPTLFKALPKEKGSLDQGSALVCWTVEKEGYCPSETWKDSTIQASWIAFDMENGGQKGLCYITGEEQPLSSKHPAKIRHSGDKAKLISSNDTSGYTYRGKFLEDNQACGIGFEVSQKAHNALAWLIQRQGFRNGDQAYVAWAISGEDIPQPTDPFAVMDDEKPKELDLGRNAAQNYALQLRNYMAGYAAKLTHNEQIIIIGIDSATPGRMGIIYYREKNNRDFLKCLETWHNDFAWYQRYTKESVDEKTNKKINKTTYPISSPVPKEIAKAAYGENVTDNLKKQTIERLLPCIVDGLLFPRDLVESCVRKASNPAAYDTKEQWIWKKNLSITCALYKGYYAPRNQHPEPTKQRDYKMALEENYHSRDYLYGRLLAVAESIESYALKEIVDEKRSTNATRLMQRFSEHPFKTWLTIHNALDPYIQRLQSSKNEKHNFFLISRQKELENISCAFVIDDFKNDEKRLSGEFLLGYYCQLEKFRPKSSSTDKTTNDTASTGATE